MHTQSHVVFNTRTYSKHVHTHIGWLYATLFIASRHHINISSQSKWAQAWLLKQNPISLWNVIKAVWLQDMFGCSEAIRLHLLDFNVEAQPQDSAGYFDEWCETKYKGDKKNDHEIQNTTAYVILFMRCFTSHKEKITLWPRFPWKIKQDMRFCEFWDWNEKTACTLFRAIIKQTQQLT